MHEHLLMKAVRNLWRDRYYRNAGKSERRSIAREWMVNGIAGRDVKARRIAREQLARQYPWFFLR